jgi:serine/threonine protein phosphatase PrpC
VFEFEINENDKFIIVASDGVWEYMTNEEVMKCVQPYYLKGSPEHAAEKIITEATNAWKRVFK